MTMIHLPYEHTNHQNPASPQHPGSRIPRLDFLRAVSAAIVIIYHTGYSTVPADFGVLTFFVISGFLITHLLLREREKTGTISFRNFYVRRALRIFPPFYVFWVVAVAASTLRHHERIIWPEAISALFYVNNYYHGLHNYPHTIFSHTWSLGVEEQFYLLWPAAFLLFHNRLGRLARALFLLIPALWLYRAAIHIKGISDSYIDNSFETRVDAILVGCLFAILLHLDLAPRLMARLSSPRYLPLTLGLLLLSILGGAPFGAAYRDIVGHAIDPILVALLILQLISTRSADWMDARPIVYLGSISYSTYLYQQLVIPVVGYGLGFAPKPIIALACIVVAWIVAALSHQFVEKPFLRMKAQFTARPISADRSLVTASPGL